MSALQCQRRHGKFRAEKSEALGCASTKGVWVPCRRARAEWSCERQLPVSCAAGAIGALTTVHRSRGANVLSFPTLLAPTQRCRGGTCRTGGRANESVTRFSPRTDLPTIPPRVLLLIRWTWQGCSSSLRCDALGWGCDTKACSPHRSPARLSQCLPVGGGRGMTDEEEMS